MYAPNVGQNSVIYAMRNPCTQYDYTFLTAHASQCQTAL